MTHPHILPKAVLLGRPNVGKSTLYNRLIRSNRAITHDRPGVTRDRMQGRVRGKGLPEFSLVDTGGITIDGHAAPTEGPEGIRGFESAILQQARQAVMESDLLCLVVDAKDGITPFDSHLADYLRKQGKNLLLVVNKVDGPEREDILTAEFHGLGFEMFACSAAHGYNVRALEDLMREKLFPGWRSDDAFTLERGEREAVAADEVSSVSDGLQDIDLASGDGSEPDKAMDPEAEPAASESEADAGPLRIALLGRPNAGKSSLVNALVGEERMIVSNIAGTTRDSVDVTTDIDGESVTFVDTAGVRRRAKITDTVERYSVNSSLKSTSKAHITLLVLDATEGLTLQDKRLIELLDERKTPFMLLINKSDLIEPKLRKATEKDYRQALNFCPHIPLLFVSAKNRHNMRSIVPLAAAIRKECSVRIPTGQLNRAMIGVLERHQPPVVRHGRAKFFYLTQAESQPPTFVFFVNDAERVLASYARYLERSLRALFTIKHAPMRVNFRSSHQKRSQKKR